MRRGEGFLLAVILAVGLVVLAPASPAAACSCVESSPVEEAIDGSAAAFTGEVTGNEGIDMMRREIVVAVDEVFAGSVDAEQLVVTHAQGPACGIDPAVGTEALFLLHEATSSPANDFAEPGELVVNSCGGQRSVAEAAALGEGRPPDRVATDDRVGAGDHGNTIRGEKLLPVLLGWAIGLGLVAVAIVAVVVRRRRARSGDPA